MSDAQDFLNIFKPGEQAGVTDSEPTPQEETAPARQAATDADRFAPETDEESLSDEERVAARFARLEEDADIPEPGQAVAGDDDEEPHPLLADDDDEDLDLDRMTPEQLRELAEEAIRLRADEDEAEREEVVEKVQAAEQQALESVQEAFQREVVAVGERHYRAIRNRQIAGLVRDAQDKDNPAQHILAGIDAVIGSISQAQAAWEQKQANSQEWTQRAHQAVLGARASVPELRRAYAEQLATERGLPKKAVDLILKSKDIDEFESRADELLATAKALGKVKARGQQELKAEARKRLSEQRVTTVATSRPRREEPPDYKGNANEGLQVLRLLRSS